MPPLLIALYGIIGAVVGSFCNVVIDRVPEQQSLLAPRSRCPGCGRQLSSWELLPVVSYLALRGTCRTCGQAIPARVVLVEAITGLLFAIALALFGWGFETIAVSLAVVFCVVLFVMDLEAMYVYDAIVYPAIVVALLIALGRMLLGQVRFSQAGLLWGWLARSFLPSLRPAQAGAISQVLGGVIGFLLFWLIYVVAPWALGLRKRGMDEAMGSGDTLLAAFCGLLVGFPGILFAAFGSFILGGVVAVILLALKKVTRESYVPFGPFLLLMTLVYVYLGDVLLGSYLGI